MTALNFLDRINCASLIQLVTWAICCHAPFSDSADNYCKNKTKKFIWGANCLQLNYGMCSPAFKILSTQIILYVILWCCVLEDGLS